MYFSHIILMKIHQILPVLKKRTLSKHIKCLFIPIYVECVLAKPVFHQNANPFSLGPRVGRPTILRYPYQHVGIQKALPSNANPCGPNANPCGPNANPCRPNANPCRPNARPNMSGGIWSHWVPLMLGFALAMLISCCLCQFRPRWVAHAKAVSSGIWAYVIP